MRAARLRAPRCAAATRRAPPGCAPAFQTAPRAPIGCAGRPPLGPRRRRPRLRPPRGGSPEADGLYGRSCAARRPPGAAGPGAEEMPAPHVPPLGESRARRRDGGPGGAGLSPARRDGPRRSQARPGLRGTRRREVR